VRAGIWAPVLEVKTLPFLGSCPEEDGTPDGEEDEAPAQAVFILMNY